MLRTKLVCTIGPASVERVDELVAAGMDVARINFSHGSREDHQRSFDAVREASKRAHRPIGVLADLPGPKIRLGELENKEIILSTGDAFSLRPSGGPGNETSAPVGYAGIVNDVRPGDRILLADGAVTLEVVDAGTEVKTVVISGGRVRSRAGINVPSDRLSLPAITERDEAALAEALDLGVDLIAQSFVRRADDVVSLRRLMGDRPVDIIAKIETRPAVEAFDQIIQRADAVMVARGDLGVEIPFEEIPVIQKDLLRRALHAGKPSIVATQMLESMLHAPRPTRAEASDVANAVLDGADALMLSGETAVGEYPIDAARAARSIAKQAQSRGFNPESAPAGIDSDPEDIARAASVLIRGTDLRAEAVVCVTRTGRTAHLLARTRPSMPIYTYALDEAVVNRLALRYAVVPRIADWAGATDTMLEMVDRRLRLDHGLAPGTVVVVVGSIPFGFADTNFLKVHRVGKT